MIIKIVFGIMLAVVSYNVGGKEYKVVGPEYKSIKVTFVSSPVTDNSTSYHESNQNLIINIKVNSFTGEYTNPIREMYPINSHIDVYYNPTNPKLAYVKRYCNKKFAF